MRLRWLSKSRTGACGILLGVCVAAVAGCDSRNPVAPRVPAGPEPRRYEAGTILGAGDLPVPASNAECTTVDNNTLCFGAIQWTRYWLADEQRLAAGQWAAIRVSGKVQVSENPEIEPHRCTHIPVSCLSPGYTFPLTGRSVGPFGAMEFPSEPNAVPSFLVEARGNDGYLLYASAPSADSSTAEFLLWGRGMDSYQLQRSGSRSGFVWCDLCAPVMAYLLSGEQTIQVTAIDPPAKVLAVAKAGSDTVHFEAQSNFGLAGVRWFFVPGDVEALPGWRNFDFADRSAWWYPGVLEDSIRGCSGKPTCDYVPPERGRMYLMAQLMGGENPVAAPAMFVSELVGAEEEPTPVEPTLVLRCDGRSDVDSVMRGNRMECTASSEPDGATVSDVRWEFQDDYGHTIQGPSGEMKWSGIMVVGGHVKVSGMVNGKPQAPTLPVTVTPRDWMGKITFPPEPEAEWTSGPPLRYPPIIEGDTLADGTLGQSSWPGPEPASGFGEGSGPNHGWYFFDQPPYFSPSQSHIYINNALTPTDPFWRAQRGPPPGQMVLGRPACGADFMRLAARHIEAHEHGHYSQAAALAKSRQGAALLESAVHWGDPVSEEEQDELIQNYRRADRAQVAHWDSVNVLHVPCEFTRP